MRRLYVTYIRSTRYISLFGWDCRCRINDTSTSVAASQTRPPSKSSPNRVLQLALNNNPIRQAAMSFCIRAVVKPGIAIACLLLLSSCRLLNPVTPQRLSATFENVVESLQSHSDPQTVRESFPTFLILIDTLILSHPDNPDLLFAGASAYDMYCQAFLVNEIDQERAATLYERAKGYGIRLLEQGGMLTNVTASTITEFEEGLYLATVNDVPYLYAAGSAWLGWILTNSASMEAIADLPKAIALMQRVIELDESHNNGAPHLVFGIYYAVQPRGAGQNLEKSKHHFDRAIELGGEDNLLPLVTYAQYYATATLDEPLFASLYERVMQTDIRKRPDIRLLNELSLQRANILWANKEEFF